MRTLLKTGETPPVAHVYTAFRISPKLPSSFLLKINCFDRNKLRQLDICRSHTSDRGLPSSISLILTTINVSLINVLVVYVP